MNRSTQEDEEKERFMRNKEYGVQRRGGMRQNLCLKATVPKSGECADAQKGF